MKLARTQLISGADFVSAAAEGVGSNNAGAPSQEDGDSSLAAHTVSQSALWELAQSMTKFEGPGPITLKPSGIPAGYTYFGQFMAHDISHRKPTHRTNSLNLDSIYTINPAASEFLSGGRFKTQKLTRSEELDLPRTVGTGWRRPASIADARNDMHFIIAQMTLAMMLFHNWVFDHLTENTESEDSRFAEAQKIVRHHFQWLVVNDYVRRVCDPAVFNEIWPNPERTLLSDRSWLDNDLVRLHDHTVGTETVTTASNAFSVCRRPPWSPRLQDQFIPSTRKRTELVTFLCLSTRPNRPEKACPGTGL